MYFRNIRLRARTALPFLSFDGDPYLVVSDSGRLRWILDAYTATSRYPYAQPLDDGTNYMRNSVKVVIDAFDGTVTAYLADPRDPLVLTLAKVFPGIFQPLDAMSARSEEHTSELQSPCNLVCRLLLEKKKATDPVLGASADYPPVIRDPPVACVRD